jgi:hypothetical protein
MSEPKFLRRAAAAKYLQENYGFCTLRVLAKLATTGGGPAYSRVGRIPLYRQEDLDAWVKSKISKPVYSTSAYRKNCEAAA